MVRKAMAYEFGCLKSTRITAVLYSDSKKVIAIFAGNFKRQWGIDKRRTSMFYI